MAKPRADKKLAKLSPVQRDQLKRWLVEDNLSYEDAKNRLYSEFEVRTSVGALSKFFAEECFVDRFEQAADFAERVAEQLADNGPDKFDEATIALVKQKAFERAAARDGSLKDLEILAGIIGDTAKLRLKQQDLDLKERRIALLEQKAAAYDEAKDLMQSQLPDEEKAARIRRAFGIA